jgi:hypothetical protein
MNVRRLFLIAVSTTLLSGGVFCGTSAFAQDLFPVDDDLIDRVHLFDSLEQPAAADSKLKASKPVASNSDVRKSRMSVAELRQARALHRSNQRVARLEYNLWMGHEPLRPNWNSIPMMSSRYTPRRVYVPVYVRAQ